MNDTPTIDVSITLLTRNPGPILPYLLEGIRMQETDRSVELVAIDTASTDNTVPMLMQHGAKVQVIEPEEFNFGLTRDRVFEMTRGDVVVCLSQDAVPAHTRWLEHLVAPLDDPQYVASCGRSVPDPDRAYPQFQWEKNGRFYFTREMAQYRARYGSGLSNANAAYRRSVWELLRFGEHPTSEDFRIQTKMHEKGYAIAFPQDAPVLHHHNYNLGELYKRCRNEGLGFRSVGCPYSFGDCLADSFRLDMAMTWGRELLKGRLRSPAALLFPWLRPVAVYAGSRYGGEYLR
jgi:rhamnosyltransferase